MVRLSWNSEWIDHFECGDSQRTCTSARPGSPADDVDRRPEDRQPLAVLEQPLVVDVELLPAGQRAPGDAALDVDRER
jgi:hypothetical protein